MKRRWIVIPVLALGVIRQARGQQLPAAANPAPNGETGATFTLRTGTNLVVTDVIVLDADGKPVHGLKQSDFVIAENHASQRIRDFQEHKEVSLEHASTALPKLAPGLFTNFAPVHSDAPANVLLLDMLNTPLRDQAYARAQIQDFLSRAPAGTQLAIFGLSDKLTILQGFTTDPAILKAVLNKSNAGKPSSLLDDSVGGGGADGAGASSISDSLGGMGGSPDILEAVANAQQFEAETQSFRFTVRAHITLDAMNELARYLANIPGRKNLIWFSGSFPISILPDPTLNNGFNVAGLSTEEFRETTSLMTKARVALYPVDARGLFNSGTFNAASSTAGTKYARNPAAVAADEAKFEQQTESDNTTMLQAAKDTGGRAFVGTNALSAAVGKAIENGSNYYTLTYSPANMKWDGRYRTIEVSLANKSYLLSYRHGYYADDPYAESTGEKRLQPAQDAAAKSVISRTMVRGAPVPTQIQFTVRVVPATNKPDSAVANGNQLATAETEARPPFTRYAVDFAIDPKDFTFVQVEGNQRDVIQFVTFVYDQDGRLINQAGATLRADFTPAVFADFVKRPFSYNQDISVPTKGSYFLRIAVHDGNSDRAGAVEIPVDAVKGLPPLSAPAANAAK